MTEVVFTCPFQEFELPDEYGLDPAAVLHFLRRQSLTPTAFLCFRKIREGTIGNFKRTESLKKGCPRGSRESISGSGRIHQFAPFIISEDKRIKCRSPNRVS